MRGSYDEYNDRWVIGLIDGQVDAMRGVGKEEGRQERTTKREMDVRMNE